MSELAAAFRESEKPATPDKFEFDGTYPRGWKRVRVGLATLLYLVGPTLGIVLPFLTGRTLGLKGTVLVLGSLFLVVPLFLLGVQRIRRLLSGNLGYLRVDRTGVIDTFCGLVTIPWEEIEGIGSRKMFKKIYPQIRLRSGAKRRLRIPIATYWAFLGQRTIDLPSTRAFIDARGDEILAALLAMKPSVVAAPLDS